VKRNPGMAEADGSEREEFAVVILALEFGGAVESQVLFDC